MEGETRESRKKRGEDEERKREEDLDKEVRWSGMRKGEDR